MRPRLLDLFCGEGGAAMGYHRAGFDIVGVDIANVEARYPFEFHRGDALTYIDKHAESFDAIHASPPCKVHTDLKHRHKEDLDSMLLPMPRHIDLLEPTWERLAWRGADIPWVIENVEGAPMISPTVLCGSMFGLGAHCVDGKYRQLRRHRLFETPFKLTPPVPCAHKGQPVGIYGVGGGGPNAATRGYKSMPGEDLEAMGTPWMSRAGCAQAIPPAYTEWLGVQLLDRLAWTANDPAPIGGAGS